MTKLTLIDDVRFEHYRPEYAIGVHETRPRISWTYLSDVEFKQQSYNIEIAHISPIGESQVLSNRTIVSTEATLVPWPLDEPLQSRQRVAVKVQGVSENGDTTPWSETSILEIGLMARADWKASRIVSAEQEESMEPQPEMLFRKEFDMTNTVASARLYITAEGVYEAEINGKRVGDYFLTPGWTEYRDRLQYQTYDISRFLKAGKNCIGVRVAEGWFNGRIGFEGGARNRWGVQNTLLVQLEATLQDGTNQEVISDDTWSVTDGPIQRAEIYDGEKYDATKEVGNWSTAVTEDDSKFEVAAWRPVKILDFFPNDTHLVAGYAEPVRKVEVVKPVQMINTTSGKVILDFGQNLVGYLRIKQVKGTSGHKITLKHAEVLEDGELGTRPLRDCSATDEYTLKGSEAVETWEPRFTFHGFRYAQIENWPENLPLVDSIEAVVCHTDMRKAGHFECSDINLSQLYRNVCWSTRGNFLSIPTDCPQRDERLGWTGDLALFAPTAAFVYQCTGILKNWFLDFSICQRKRDGLPPTVCPDTLAEHILWGLKIPLAIWHDVAVLGPWAVYSATGDVEILKSQYDSMQQWIRNIPRYNDSRTPNLWHPRVFQLGVSTTCSRIYVS